MTDPDDDRPGTFASPPCFMHEIDPAYASVADPHQWVDVRRWRKAERARLIAARLALSGKMRRQQGEMIAAHLETAIGDPAGLTISAYWPFRGEPDLRHFLERVRAGGGQTALPVVVARDRPLVFRAWAPGDALTRGVWNIPTPPESAAAVLPDVVIAPVVGFDPACYRLGYGGGFFDRTLAALPRRPGVLGVGWCQAAMPTIYPQPHDIPMDVVITEDGPTASARNTEAASGTAGHMRP
jgi:5,10-methenyltetrahydrofolate synthetase